MNTQGLLRLAPRETAGINSCRACGWRSWRGPFRCTLTDIRVRADRSCEAFCEASDDLDLSAHEKAEATRLALTTRYYQPMRRWYTWNGSHRRHLLVRGGQLSMSLLRGRSPKRNYPKPYYTLCGWELPGGYIEVHPLILWKWKQCKRCVGQ